MKTGNKIMRLFGIALCLVLALCLLPNKADAANIASGEGWYLDEAGCLHITGAVHNPSTTWKDEIPWRKYKDRIITVLAESGASIDNGSMLFYYCSNMTTCDLSKLNTSNVTNMNGMFYQCSRLTTLDVSGFDTSNVTDMSGMFYNCTGLTALDLSGFDTSKVTDMGSMFYNCSSLTTLDVSGFDTSGVTSMYWMFYKCSSLTTLDVSGFDTSNVTGMSYMFFVCTGLTALDVSGFDTSNVTHMSWMFSYCSGLTALDVSGFDTSNVTDMFHMFFGCTGLTALDVSGFDTSKVTDMGAMFSGCTGLTALDVSGFDTSKVTDMGGMFYNCTGLTALDVSGFDTAKVKYMGDMFYNCTGLTQLGTNHDLLVSSADQVIKIYSPWQAVETGEVYNTASSLLRIPGKVTLVRYVDMAATFTDVKPTAWYYPYVDYAVNHGIMKGTGATTFEPNGNMTRAQLAQIFYNLADQPQVTGKNPFTDVKEKHWYYAPVVWAVSEGIVSGTSATTFGPNQNITRQDMVVMMYRAYGKGETAPNHLNEFKDGAKVSSYARNAVNWAVEHGCLKGSDGKLSPKDNMTRAQVATVFMNYLEGNK